jgi:hypothetical protein
MGKLYEYHEVLWEFNSRGYRVYVVPFCPIHKMELNSGETFGYCEDCNKRYQWGTSKDRIAEFLRRKIGSKDYQDAEIISIDGIQTPQLKSRIKIPEENEEYWMEARLNRSGKIKF